MNLVISKGGKGIKVLFIDDIALIKESIAAIKGVN